MHIFPIFFLLLWASAIEDEILPIETTNVNEISVEEKTDCGCSSETSRDNVNASIDLSLSLSLDGDLITEIDPILQNVEVKETLESKKRTLHSGHKNIQIRLEGGDFIMGTNNQKIPLVYSFD